MAWSTGRAHRRVGLALVLGLVVGGLALTAAPTASAQTLQDIEVRDKLIADQEALLNTYRCMFGVDTQVVPSGCSNSFPALPPQKPGQFSGTPTARDIAVRDQLIADQEALLNIYRCQFDIDTELVPDGCQGDSTIPTPVTPENLGPVAPSGEAWAERMSIVEFIRACGYVEREGQCRNHPEDTNEVIRRLSELYNCEWSDRWGGCYGYSGERMRQLENELFCQGGWIFWRRAQVDSLDDNAPGYCFHPDHPAYGIDSQR